MLEIYNEQVKDLLSKDNPKGGLNVRQNPKLGLFYVENLKKIPVGSYAEIEKRMDQGRWSSIIFNQSVQRVHLVEGGLKINSFISSQSELYRSHSVCRRALFTFH